MVQKIPIVEDYPDINNIYSLVLKDSECNVKTAQNGKDALGHVLSFEPDIILLDIMIPGMDGIKVLHTISLNIILF